MSGMIANIAIILGSMQLSKRIDWEDKNVLNYIRVAYLASNLIVFSLFAYMYLQIQKKSGPYLF
jgi:Ca2+/Na+ antiporter